MPNEGFIAPVHTVAPIACRVSRKSKTAMMMSHRGIPSGRCHDFMMSGCAWCDWLNLAPALSRFHERVCHRLKRRNRPRRAGFDKRRISPVHGGGGGNPHFVNQGGTNRGGHTMELRCTGGIVTGCDAFFCRYSSWASGESAAALKDGRQPLPCPLIRTRIDE